MPIETITSLRNPRVKNLVKLRERRQRDRQGVFLIEGYRELFRAFETKIPVAEVYFSPEWFLGSNEEALLRRAEAAGASLFRLSRDSFSKCAYRERPDGLLGVAPRWEKGPYELELPPDPLVLVAEGIEKPGNLGTLLRGADAAGVDAVLLCDPVTDLFNPNVVRASTGVLFSMPVAVADTSAAIRFLKEKRIRTVATTPAAERLYTDADLRGPLALVMGSERYGLGDAWLREADEKVRIPMAGRADSVNVSMATIITLFEAVRQRGI